MRDTSPPESCHVMEASELTAAGATLYSLSDGDEVIGIGALKPLDPGVGELKSMHVAAEARGKGASKALLDALLEAARAEGMHRVNLETGVEDVFAAARGLYLRYGFEECPPFGDYGEDPLSVFMTKAL
ncbi:MAG: GNAT family N-acetyltransferase [Dinoroseobacter sp.]|nr:GNAT family N-acetyltransferase [Dinoroseobacter sp.]